MGLVGFGQPDDGVIQMAYVVEDIRASMHSWVQKLGVGPWFLLEHFTGTDPKSVSYTHLTLPTKRIV